MFRFHLICLAFVNLAAGAVAHGNHNEHRHDHNRDHHDHYDMRGLQEVEVNRCATKSWSTEEFAQIEEELMAWQDINGVCNPTYCPIREQVPEISISTVWHNIKKSDGTGGLTFKAINDSMTVLNAAYASAGFSFTLVATTETNSDEYYYHEYGTTAEFNMKNALRQGDATTLNLYSTELPGDLLGYATFPSDYVAEPKLDGVVIIVGSVPGGSIQEYDKGITLVHEVGHWLLLLHPFEGETCSSNGDVIFDTPFQSTPSFGCPAGKDSCPLAPGLDSINNYMDYTLDACKNTFSKGQITRMVTGWFAYRDRGPPFPMPAPTTPSPISPTTRSPISPTTPSPTLSPTVAPLSCFSEKATAVVQDQGAVEVVNLSTGDKVLTSNGYHTLFAFAHQAHRSPEEFLQIHTKEHGNYSLEITRQHLVFVQGQPHAVPAHTIRVGDLLQSTQRPNGVLVVKITSIYRKGLYAPITTEGTVEVDGIVSSCYVALQNNANEYFELRGGVTTGLSQHFVVHLGMAPVRMACIGISADLCELYDEVGLAFFAKIGFAIFDFINSQVLPIQVLLLALYLVVFGSLYSMECIFGPKLAVLILLALAAAVGGCGVNHGRKKQLD